jgi:hypothetical protein
MSGTARPWPICPRHQLDESVPSWFERVGHEYTMSRAVLLAAVEREIAGKRTAGPVLLADRLLEQPVTEQLAALRQLTDPEKSGLWPPPSDWELKDQAFGVYCPYCCLNDLANNRTPYGRQYWLQSWCTICKAHGSALVLRKPTPITLVAYRSEARQRVSGTKPVQGSKSSESSGAAINAPGVLALHRANRGRGYIRYPARRMVMGQACRGGIPDDPHGRDDLVTHSF